MAKLSRNGLCACGSGKKYKRCCGNPSRSDVSESVIELQRAGLEYDAELQKSINSKLRQIAGRSNLSRHEKITAEVALVQSLQKLGDHAHALERLSLLTGELPDDPYLPYLTAKSLERLGSADKALRIYGSVMPKLKSRFSDRKFAMLLLEHGRACAFSGKEAEAIEIWTNSAKILADNPEDTEHYARAISNIAGLQLHSQDESVRDIGEKEMLRASDLKAQVGDVEGLSNNFSRLSLYYMKQKRYERAIAFARKDLWLARVVGDEHGLAASLGNLAIIYLDALQLTSARTVLAEAREIGERLRQPSILNMVQVNLEAVNAEGREAGRAGKKVGPIADCACGSGKTYQSCCGRADFQPDIVLPGFAGFSQDAATLRAASTDQSSAIDWLEAVMDLCGRESR